MQGKKVIIDQLNALLAFRAGSDGSILYSFSNVPRLGL